MMSKSGVTGFFYRMLCGAFLGISIIAPGISGSIMAVMMGIYDELIGIISNPFKNLKKNIIYIFPMGIGAVISILLLINALDFLFENYTVPAYLLFMSLILGSVPTVIGEAKKERIKKRYFIGTIIAFVFALSIGMLAKNNLGLSIDTGNVLSTSMRIYLPVCGLVSGMMSMLPGMSISMLLMMFGVYETLLKLAKGALSFDRLGSSEWISEIIVILTIVAAFLAGMVLFSNVTKRILKKHHSFGFMMILGFMTGSIISIFPGLPSDAFNWCLSVLAIVIGVSVSYLFKVLGKKFNVEK